MRQSIISVSLVQIFRRPCHYSGVRTVVCCLCVLCCLKS